MSDVIKHECGIVHLRLRKPLQYYIEKYKSPAYAAQIMYLLMKKQANRGQDGVGVANIKLDMPPGYRYISRYRTTEENPIEEIFQKIYKKYEKTKKKLNGKPFDSRWLKENCAFTGESWLGHLRYGTHGRNSIENCHPFLRQNNWHSRNIVMAGNFNMTNTDELFDMLVQLGQFPKEKVDTVTVMEKIGHFLDEENQEIFNKYKGEYSNKEISTFIENEINLKNVLSRSCRDFDGGYVIAGIVGFGASFVARDPHGIRPAYYYANDEIVVVTSEKPPIKTVFDCSYKNIKEIQPGHALIIDKHGNFQELQFIQPQERKSCSFERIYFSRGTDPDIYRERKILGEQLVPAVLKAIGSNLKNTVFSYIPHTAEISFFGLMNGLERYLFEKRREVILENKISSFGSKEELLSFQLRIEKLILKNGKLRTFITNDEHRDQMVANVYDTTYEIIKKETDTLVVVDDSIVRGTTLKKSILILLDKLQPKKIVLASSAPQIRFPDCYGIDMSKINEFIAFKAVIELLKETHQQKVIDTVFQKCLNNENKDNYVKELYAPFTYDQISKKISEIIKPKSMKVELEVVYQTIENLHKACPNHLGDWYFTGDYPTKGGNKVVNRAFVNYMKGLTHRSY